MISGAWCGGGVGVCVFKLKKGGENSMVVVEAGVSKDVKVG